jgi:hypothetical protein
MKIVMMSIALVSLFTSRIEGQTRATPTAAVNILRASQSDLNRTDVVAWRGETRSASVTIGRRDPSLPFTPIVRPTVPPIVHVGIPELFVRLRR